MNTQWFQEALAESLTIEYAHTKLKIVSPIGLLVTKYLTFRERGDGDYYASHDLENFITVIDGRDNIVDEVENASPKFRNYLIDAVQSLLSAQEFRDALPGHLPSDFGSQQRLPLLKQKLNAIADLRHNRGN